MANEQNHWKFYLKKLSSHKENNKSSNEDDLLYKSEKFFLGSYNADELVEKIDEISEGETESAELAKKKIENDALKHALEEAKKDSGKKDDFYKTVKGLTIKWIAFIAILVLVNSIDVPWNEGIYEFNIESKVLIALITSTTASVIGLFFIVGRYLFPNNKKE